MLRIFAFGSKFVFRTNFVFATEFRLQRAQNRISSSHEFRLQGRFSSSNIVFAHSLSFSSWRTISSSKASEFRLQGGTKPGPSFPGQCTIGQTCSMAHISNLTASSTMMERCVHHKMRIIPGCFASYAGDMLRDSIRALVTTRPDRTAHKQP